MKNSFFLIIPPQRKSPEHVKQFTESALKHWVEALPTANPSLATRLFHDFIMEFNQLDMESALRLDALEILRPSYIIIEEYLRSRLMQSSFPKAPSDQKVMDILFAIEKEFTLGYWIVARDLTQKEVSWFQNKTIALAIQRCIKGLSAIVITFCSLYRAIPDWVWIDLHSLYKLSESLNKQAIKVPAEFNHAAKTTTIEISYQQILLFSLAQPGRLMQKEIQQVYLFLESVSPYLRIEDSPVANLDMQCVLRMDDDKPPSFQRYNPASNDSAIRHLNFDKLLKAFKNKDKFSDPGLTRFSSIGAQPGSYAKLSVDLLEYLEQRWKALPLPALVVFADRLDRFIGLGLEAAFNLRSAVVASSEQDVEHLAQSASEFSLACDFTKLGVLSVGSLISIKKIDAPEHKRALGVVSKLVTFKQDNKLNIDVDLLAEQFYAVSFEYLEEKKQPLRKKALLYGVKEQGKEEKSFIIIESFMLKDGDIIRMFMQNEDYPIILKDRKNIGLGYWQFECRRMPETDSNINKRQGYDFI
ncbi:MAG: hypothetical protein HOP02_10875 [Methylococcaceae bacterium]|nr:hypothetical protein [Methylococcaceae bacterium]